MRWYEWLEQADPKVPDTWIKVRDGVSCFAVRRKVINSAVVSVKKTKTAQKSV